MLMEFKTQVLMAQQMWPQAMKKIDAGLKQAKSLGLSEEVGDFLVDLSKAKVESKDLYGSLDSLRKAAPIFASLGRIPKIGDAVERASQIAASLNPSRARTVVIRMELDIMDGVDPNMCARLCTYAVRTLKEGLIAAGLTASKKPLREFSDVINREVNSRGSDASPQLMFVAKVIEMLSAYASGRTEDARQTAEGLDQLSNGGFSLVRFMEEMNYLPPRALPGLSSKSRYALATRLSGRRKIRPNSWRKANACSCDFWNPSAQLTAPTRKPRSTPSLRFRMR